MSAKDTKPVIAPNARVVLDYTLRDSDDDIVDASDANEGEPIVYVHGYGMLVPGLEKALTGLEVGAKRDIIVQPEEGFGERDEDLVLEIDRSEMPRPDAIEIGDELVAESPDGEEALMRVVAVKANAVVLDGNHPLAGETLTYSVHVREVRPATDAEIEEAATDFDDAAAPFDAPAVDGAGASLVQLGRSGTVVPPKKLMN